MRTIPAAAVSRAVADLCIRANRRLPPDVQRAFLARQQRESPLGKDVLRQLLDNAQLSESLGLPLCQDCGMAVFFVERGEGVRVDGPGLRRAIEEGMVRGYREGFLRASTCHPFTRVNRGDNTPAVIHFDVVPGDALRIVLAPEGAGCESASRAVMLGPEADARAVREFVIRRVAEVCQEVCAPLLVGVGLGGSLELCALNARKALLRPLGEPNPDADAARLEDDLREALNRLGVGPLGLGGTTTCLAARVLAAPAPPDALPLAVTVQCHCVRRAEAAL